MELRVGERMEEGCALCGCGRYDGRLCCSYLQSHARMLSIGASDGGRWVRSVAPVYGLTATKRQGAVKKKCTVM